jgi:hypothetical protein
LKAWAPKPTGATVGDVILAEWRRVADSRRTEPWVIGCQGIPGGNSDTLCLFYVAMENR